MTFIFTPKLGVKLTVMSRLLLSSFITSSYSFNTEGVKPIWGSEFFSHLTRPAHDSVQGGRLV